MFVPALTGLGAPHWDPHARGTDHRHHPRHDARPPRAGDPGGDRLRGPRRAGDDARRRPVHRCASTAAPRANDLLCQLQADQLGVPVERPRIVETTALGAAFLAGLGTGVWDSTDDLRETWQLDRRFEPTGDRATRRRRRRRVVRPLAGGRPRAPWPAAGLSVGLSRASACGGRRGSSRAASAAASASALRSSASSSSSSVSSAGDSSSASVRRSSSISACSCRLRACELLAPGLASRGRGCRSASDRSPGRPPRAPSRPRRASGAASSPVRVRRAAPGAARARPACGGGGEAERLGHRDRGADVDRVHPGRGERRDQQAAAHRPGALRRRASPRSASPRPGRPPPG